MRILRRLQCLVVAALVIGLSHMGLTAYADQPRRVLILPDAFTDGTDALFEALKSAGYDVTLSQAVEFNWDGTNPHLTGFDAVIHLNGATSHTPLAIQTQVALVEFVRNGGNFIGSQFNGYEQADKRQIDMPDLVLQLWPHPDNCNECEMEWAVVPGQERHPVLKGVPGTFTFFADAHDAGPLVEFPANPALVLMTSPAAGPAVTVREFGLGRVVNFSFAPNSSTDLTLQDPNIQLLYVNAVAWQGDTLEQSIEILTDDVRELVNDGALKPVPGFFLILRLKTAQRQLDEGNRRAAVFLLGKFNYHTEDLINDGSLAESEGQPLVDAARKIIEDIKQ